VNYNVDHIDDLIGKYLAGEAARDEIHFVESWAKQSSENQKYLDQCKSIFTRASVVSEWQEFDTDAAWTKLKGSLKKSDTPLIPLHKPRKNFYWQIAASIIVILGVGFFAYKLAGPGSLKSVEVITEKATKSDTLPDGSDVFLNKKTELTYAYDKKKKNHLVKLKGEAYFNIHHEDDKNFIIDASGVLIKDIGTSFNVKAYPGDSTVEVVVEEGKVMFYTDTDSGVYLSANGKGIYNKRTKTFTVEEPELNVLAYKTKFFSFSDTTLRSVVEELNGVYDKKIVLDPSLRDCHLTVSFNNEDIDEIAAIIAETLGLSIVRSETEIRLQGSGCAK
jgi:ferric-dicitrate binding protein FerR (iron transport regulator)